MKPAAFDFYSLKSLDEISSSLAEHGSEAKILAGGQSLVPAMNFRLLQPKILLDINRVSELDYIDENNEKELIVGSMTRQSALEKSSLVQEKFPLLFETMPQIAHSQIRNRGTIGGNLVHADPASELPAVCIAMNALIKTRSLKGERLITAEEFFEGMFVTALGPDEFLVEIIIPPPPENSGSSFIEFSRRQGDYALMGIAAVINLDKNGKCKEAKLVYLNAGDGPINAIDAGKILVGEKASDKLFEEVSEIASEKEIDPFGNVHATVPYQRHLAKILTQRALRQAFARANHKDSIND